MIESIVTILVAGVLAGIIFSMPAAGPISILITSNALKGKLRFCERTALGASIVEFFYIFIAVYGLTALYLYYRSLIPYLLIIGSIFILLVGIRILKSRLDLNTIDDKGIISDKLKNRGGLRTGIIINATNPSVFIGWIISSFIVLSFISSLGLNTGGLDIIINDSVTSISKIAAPDMSELDSRDSTFTQPGFPEDQGQESAFFIILLSIIYALAVSTGTFLWFYNYSRFIIRHRFKLPVKLLNRILKFLGVCLIFVSCYLVYQAVVSLSQGAF